jgi:hypothetical protein
MALIEVFHVVASQYPIATASGTDIPQGRVVTLDANGEVQLALDADTVTGPYPVGIAGDSRSDGTTSYTPESGSPLNQQDGLTKATDLDGSLILGAYGDSQRFTQNRVADQYNEVLASGKMTVYHSGGEFWTDQYEVTNSASAATTFTPGFTVWSSSVAANLGMFTDEESADATQELDPARSVSRLYQKVATACRGVTSSTSSSLSKNTLFSQFANRIWLIQGENND